MYPQSVALHISPLFLSRVFFSFFSSAAHSGAIKFKTTGQHVCRITNELMISSSLLCIPFLLPIYLWFICRSIVLSPQLLLPGFCLLFVSHQSIHWFWDYFRASLFHQFLFDTIKSNCSFSPSLSSCLLGCTMHSVLSVSHVSITYVSIILWPTLCRTPPLSFRTFPLYLHRMISTMSLPHLFGRITFFRSFNLCSKTEFELHHSPLLACILSMLF